MRVTSSGMTASIPPAISRELRAARQFEAVLLANVFGALQKTFTEIGGKPSDPGAENYSAMGMQALAEGLAGTGGIGIAPMIAADLTRRGSAASPTTPEQVSHARPGKFSGTF